MVLGLGSDTLSQEHLENLQYYKYAAVDKSFVSQHILRHYWNFSVKLFPLWMAPNLITLIGLLFMVFNILLVVIYVPDFDYETQNPPSWIFYSFAIGLWLYSTFDNVDGKQARRTGTSSPLGELFDHGCDALNATYVAILQIAALGLGKDGLLMNIIFITTTVGFYLSTIEEYYTGVLYLGYINGPCEGIIVTCLAYLWSGWFGVSSWHIPFSEVDGLKWITKFGVIPETTTGAQFFAWGFFAFLILTHVPVVIYSMYKACQQKKLNFYQVSLHAFTPIILFSLAQYAWSLSSTSIVVSGGHFLLFALANGTLFGLMVSSVILAHLTKQKFPNLFTLVLPVIIISLLINAKSVIGIRLISPTIELVLIWLQFITFVFIYGTWIKVVIDGFCKYLGIRCLVIVKKDTLDHAEQGNASTSSDNQYGTFSSNNNN
ncbi:CDP-alcohol phosphatidyltransferase-domain-containing protein [Cunninghamella echinulata]|nr:CDP-alcohol phosphatidyltransferase-domain-containing protein [Cunninghamella echinulata]